ncbi:hypothetical protein KI387_020165, partial [Taxus chinensis]
GPANESFHFLFKSSGYLSVTSECQLWKGGGILAERLLRFSDLLASPPARLCQRERMRFSFSGIKRYEDIGSPSREPLVLGKKNAGFPLTGGGILVEHLLQFSDLLASPPRQIGQKYPKELIADFLGIRARK